MGLFNANAPLSADINLFFQVVILIVLLLGVLFKSKRNYLSHGAAMSASFVLHIISIFAVMIPSLLASMGLFENLLHRLALTIAFHSVLGSAVALIGIYPIGTWILHRVDANRCFKNKKAMQVTIILWLIELATGIITYVLLYAS